MQNDRHVIRQLNPALLIISDITFRIQDRASVGPFRSIAMYEIPDQSQCDHTKINQKNRLDDTVFPEFSAGRFSHFIYGPHEHFPQ